MNLVFKSNETWKSFCLLIHWVLASCSPTWGSGERFSVLRVYLASSSSSITYPSACQASDRDLETHCCPLVFSHHRVSNLNISRKCRQGVQKGSSIMANIVSYYSLYTELLSVFREVGKIYTSCRQSLTLCLITVWIHCWPMDTQESVKNSQGLSLGFLFWIHHYDSSIYYWGLIVISIFDRSLQLNGFNPNLNNWKTMDLLCCSGLRLYVLL